MSNPGEVACIMFNKKLDNSKVSALNALQLLTAIYYMFLASVGFRNIYVIFYK